MGGNPGCDLAIMTFSMVFLRFLKIPFYLYIAMASPLIGISASGLHASFYLGWSKTLLFFLVTLILSMFLETFGVATGLLYGEYHYTYRLGPLFLGHTPYLIPLTWFMMLYPSYVIATVISRRLRIENSFNRQLIIAGIGGLVMTAWDLVLDPVMVIQEHWVWDEVGKYFGIPFQNFLGWWITGFIILMMFLWVKSRLKDDVWQPQQELERLAILIYMIIGFGNIAGAMISGLWGPAFIGFSVMLFWAVVSWRSLSKDPYAKVDKVVDASRGYSS